MRRVGAWLSTKPIHHASSKSLTALDEQQALQDALASAALIMNDEIERAESELSKGTSPFHKLGEATALFLRATLGFEKEMMEQAGNKIAEAEEAAAEHQRRAIRDSATAHHSAIYALGAEYALCHAETQIMSAVLAVLNESLTESLRGFYKLRKAFSTLSEINEAEKRYIRMHRSGTESRMSLDTSLSSVANNSSTPDDSNTRGIGSYPSSLNDSEDDDLDFVDAKDEWSGPVTPTDYKGHMHYPESPNSTLRENVTDNLNNRLSLSSANEAGVDVPSGSAVKAADQEIDFGTITSDPIDLFIHSGTALCYGLLQLLLSMIPPSFAKILSLFSFRGNRAEGLRMLWSATKFKANINGAMSGLIVLGFHSGPVAFCDILSKDALPDARLRALLSEMREMYPGSKLWLLEEAKMMSRNRRLEDAVETIANGPTSSLKQVEALGIFEMSLQLMYSNRYQECAESFIKCVGMNNWSHALYYYISGACHIELYRIAKLSNPEKAKEFAAKAEKYLQEVPSHAGKRRFMARQLPFDAFVSRKLTKWDARAKTQGCNLVDAVGVSPVVEMIYFWSGFRRMRPEHIEKCLERLAWSEDKSENPHWQNEAADEKAILHLLRGVCMRNLEQISEAKSILTDQVMSQDPQHLKSCEHPDTWPLPVAHYEKAVCYWQEAGGEDGDRSLLMKCSEELARVERWDTFELEARIGLKITTARQTLKKAGIEAP